MSTLPPDRQVGNENQEFQGRRKRLDRALERVGTASVLVFSVLWGIAHIIDSPWSTWLGTGLLATIVLAECHMPRLGLWIAWGPYQSFAANRHDQLAIKVFRYYRNAAARGNPSAMNFLGLIYGDGIGVPVDFAEARRWFEAAALRGLAVGARNLGEIYFKGSLEIPRDLANALMWFEVAKELGWPLDQEAVHMVTESAAGLDLHAIEAAEHQAKQWVVSNLKHVRKA